MFACEKTVITDQQKHAPRTTTTAQHTKHKKHTPVAVESSTKERKYQLLEWMSKLCAIALPNSKVPTCPKPSFSTQLSAPAVGMAPAPKPTL